MADKKVPPEPKLQGGNYKVSGGGGGYGAKSTAKGVDPAGNVRLRGEDPSPDDRRRGEISRSDDSNPRGGRPR